MPVYALSDIHVDYAENMAWLEALSPTAFQQDTLLVAGDVTHDMTRLRHALSVVGARFRRVFFVPGNHELWVMKGERGTSLDKFQRILDLCRELGVGTEPEAIEDAGTRVWIVPLFSWYVTPEEGRDTLYIPKRGGDQGMKVWSDSYFVKWPEAVRDLGPSNYFLDVNRARVERSYDAPVISFSHFLSRKDLLFTYGTDMEAVYRLVADEPTLPRNDGEGFNFSRVAGSRGLETQIRRLSARVHVHGHQHRNRFREVDGVRYVSHCLGYKHERLNGILPQVDAGPLKIWDPSPAWDPAEIAPY